MLDLSFSLVSKERLRFFKKFFYLWGTSVSLWVTLLQVGLKHRSLVTSPWSLVRGQRSLITGHWSLVTGHWSLVTGHRSLVTGHWALVTGHWS